MKRAKRGIPFFAVVLFAAEGAIIVSAALTSWWVLLTLIPLTMMLGCAVMMAGHGRMQCAPGTRRACCAVSAPSREGGSD